MKKIFYTMAVAAALFAGYSAYSEQNKSNISNMVLPNIEAISACEVFKGDKLVFECEGKEGTCTEKYLNVTLTCSGKKVAI